VIDGGVKGGFIVGVDEIIQDGVVEGGWVFSLIIQQTRFSNKRARREKDLRWCVVLE
jgi:hypothetical protein